MDRFTEAYNRIHMIMEILDYAGFDINDPWSFESLDVPELWFATGATRLVVGMNDYPDYVAKIALNEEDEKYNIHEVELYQAAEREGLGEHFGWCAEIYDYGCRSVYAMEYLDCNYEEMDSESYQWGYERYCAEENLDSEDEDNKEAFNDYYWSCGSCDDMILDWFEDKLVRPVAAKFDRFVYDHDISDLHAANIGKRGNQLVLCDYAGYGW